MNVLGQIAQPDAPVYPHFSTIGREFPPDDPKEGRLSGAVGSDDTDVVSGFQLKREAIKKPLSGKRVGKID
jgi:hypothetical protein